jgi:hypothetical protein
MKKGSIDAALDEVAAVREVLADPGTSRDFPILETINRIPEADQRAVMQDVVAFGVWLGLKLAGVK